MMKHKFNKSVSLLVVVFMLMALVISGCGKSDSQTSQSTSETAKNADQKITVLLPKHEMDNKGFMEKETREFESKSGIKVELINMSWDNVADRVTTEMASGGSSYDVIEFDNSWVSKFVTNDWVTSIDDYVTAEMKEGILPGLLSKFSYKEKLYGIPWNNDTRFFMYNKKKLDDAGIAAPPRTWAELEEQTKILQGKGLVKYGYIDSYMQSQSAPNQITFAVYSFGADYFDADGNLSIAGNPALKSAYEFLRKGINETKIIDPSSLTSNYETIANVFCKGDTAFFLQAWPGIYTMANDAETSKIVGEIAVAPYSIGVDEKTNAVLTLPEAMAVPKASKVKDEAWKYIEYMSSKEFDKKKALEIGALPIWKDSFNDEELLKVYPYWKDFGKQALSAKGLQDILWYDQFSNILQVESLKILLGEVSVDEGLKNMEEQCKQAMN